MRILIPILGFANQGGYRVLSKLADAWLDMGNEVSFLVPETSLPPYFPTKATIIRTNRRGALSNELSRTPTTRSTTGIDNILSLFTGLNAVGAGFDVILANHCLTAWPVKLARCGAAKKIYYIQADEPQYFKFWSHPIKHVLARLSYHLGLIHISNAQTYPARSAKRPAGFVPPGIDIDNFYCRTDRKNLATADVVILGTIGRTEPYKGTKLVLDAFEKLHLANPRFHMHVAFGNLPPDWSHPAVKVIAVKNDAELADYYRSLDILMVGCKGQEGAPHYPVIEGLAVGTPVVHTGYFPGNHENSWPVAQGDLQALVDGVMEVVRCNDTLAKTQKGQDFVCVNLTWPALAKSMLVHFK